MTTKQALNFFKSQAGIAKAIGISRQAVNKWGKYPPLLQQLKIEDATSGELLATRPAKKK